ncbi:hypothetical protein KIW84_030835 [Lathyrus oleraceus]|uniref:DUF4283 domain-containing protein n=1 Tax=Pisum sativum TaxID=3888 RepID=A0A9D4XP83_PEA|nr:hypothetical protein KIW84_030835 [Pisum sativum]
MEKWKNIPLFKEEEDRVTGQDDEVSGQKRDLESVIQNGPWNFDRNLLVLDRVSGEEQPSGVDMHFGTFCIRVYDLSLMLRSKTMAKKIGDIMGSFEEMGSRETHRIGRFLRIKVKMDLKQPMKRGTMLIDCEAIENLSDEGYEDVDEQNLSYGLWSRVSPFRKVFEEAR